MCPPPKYHQDGKGLIGSRKTSDDAAAGHPFFGSIGIGQLIMQPIWIHSP